LSREISREEGLNVAEAWRAKSEIAALPPPAGQLPQLFTATVTTDQDKPDKKRLASVKSGRVL
jgi:hypothetical protein